MISANIRSVEICSSPLVSQFPFEAESLIDELAKVNVARLMKREAESAVVVNSFITEAILNREPL